MNADFHHPPARHDSDSIKWAKYAGRDILCPVGACRGRWKSGWRMAFSAMGVPCPSLDYLERLSGHLSKTGNAYLRAALYMLALSAVCHDPNAKAFYEALQKREEKNPSPWTDENTCA
jgi:hypothetical protein